MLVKFAIDPQALVKESNPLPTDFESLIERWENFGILVNPDQLEDEIDSFEFNIRVQLEEIFKDDQTPRRYRCKDIAGQLDWEYLLENDGMGLKEWSETLELAVIGELLADEIGVGIHGEPLSDEVIQATYGDVEPIGLARSHRARAWRHAWNIARLGFTEGESHETLWNERFSRLSQNSEQIVVIDMHALENRQYTGFVRLLELISSQGNACLVTLFSSPPANNDESVEGARRQLCEDVGRLGGSGVRQVTVRFFDSSDDETRMMLHDRRIRFDCTVFAPENSIALVFSSDNGTVPQNIGCTLLVSDVDHHPYDAMKTRENDLLRKARALNWLRHEKDFAIFHPKPR